MLIKAQEEVQGGTLAGGSPFFLWVCTCAPIRWEVFVSLSCLSTPFLWCLPKETVSSRQRKALFYPGDSTIRVSAAASVDGGHLRPTFAGGWCWSGALYVCAVTLGGGRWPVLPFDPISLVLAQRNGVEPPKKSAFLPRRLHHPRERFCLGCLYSSSPDLGRGLAVDRALKSA